MEGTTSSDCQKSCFNSTTQPMKGCICVKSITYSSAPDLNRELDSYIKNSLYGFAAATKMIEALGTNITGNSIADFLQENSPENTLALFFSVATRLLQDQRVANSVASTLLNRSDEIKLALQNINSLNNSFLSYIASVKHKALKQNIQKVREQTVSLVSSGSSLSESSSSGSSSSDSSSSGSSSSGNTKRADEVAVLVQAIIDMISG